MRYSILETHDFKCRLCDTNWLSYIENNSPCPNPSQDDGRHNFDFGKPIRIEAKESQVSSPEAQEGNITFQ
jgi:hypothetical protein